MPDNFMAKCLHELPARYKSAREVIQKDLESSREYISSVSFDFVLMSLITNYDAFSVGVCSKNEHAEQNQELKGHTDSRAKQYSQIHESMRNAVAL